MGASYIFCLFNIFTSIIWKLVNRIFSIVQGVVLTEGLYTTRLLIHLINFDKFSTINHGESILGGLNMGDYITEEVRNSALSIINDCDNNLNN